MKYKTHVLFCFFLNYFMLNSAAAASKSSNRVSLLLGCGTTSEESDSDGRKWVADSKFLVGEDKSMPARAAVQDPSLPSTVPYMNTRIFTSESTYSFSVPPNKHHWLRLHFYPSTYSTLNSSDSYFSVVAGGATLLKNFSASITALALSQSYIVREFILNPIPNGVVNVTFTPDDKHNGSYAFINGIELATVDDLFGLAAMVGYSFSDSFVVNGSTLQTMYRLNVGGQFIPAINDSGLTRTWYDDSPYVYGAAFGVTTEPIKGVEINFPEPRSENIAPHDVYSTARTMGPDSKLNLNFNLTWVFQVDANFTYVVRLHFCEIRLTKVNQRVFDIFINNQTAQENADVLAWTGTPGTPFYQDFVIYVADAPGDEQLWVALHPSTSAKPETYDAILNGLEVFKLNDTTGNLAGPNPVPSPMMIKAEEARQFAPGKSNKHAAVIGGAAGSAAAVGLVAALCIAFYQRKKRILSDGSDSGVASAWLPLYGNSTNSKSNNSGKGGKNGNLSTLAAGLCRHFSLAEIKQGTQNFEESEVIGLGGFGKVYKGTIDSGATQVAIKRANPSSEQGLHEFRTEIEMLSKLRHRHLVSLIGFCEENDEMILVYDYMSHGTLREHLYKNNKIHLSWKQRLEICIGAARGLHYLHTGAKYTIIHRDVKTTNILVDENWVAKVSDFGLSKTGPNLNQTHVSTVVKGSFGYLDPEYFRRQQLTEKSDVYSFGVVLFEVLCARPALNPSLSREQVSLADWALHCQRNGMLEDIVDPTLKGKINPESMKKFAETAEKCLSDQGIDRPAMGDVLWNLEFALQLHENNGENSAEGGKPNVTPGDENNINDHDTHFNHGSESTLSEESDGLNSSAVFSQLVNPQGR